MITFAEVKTFTKRRAHENKAVGICGNATACLVAEAVLDKYEELHNVYVGWSGEHDMDLVIYGSEDVDPARLYHSKAWIGDHNDPEVAKIVALIKLFDRLPIQGEVAAVYVLPLFDQVEESFGGTPAQVDTGINEAEDIPDYDEDDPFADDDWDDDEDEDEWEDDWDDEDEDEE